MNTYINGREKNPGLLVKQTKSTFISHNYPNVLGLACDNMGLSSFSPGFSRGFAASETDRGRLPRPMDSQQAPSASPLSYAGGHSGSHNLPLWC